jgi:hypothetical protein
LPGGNFPLGPKFFLLFIFTKTTENGTLALAHHRSTVKLLVDANYLQNFPRQKLLDPVNGVGDPFFFGIQNNYAFCNGTIEVQGQCREGL